MTTTKARVRKAATTIEQPEMLGVDDLAAKLHTTRSGVYAANHRGHLPTAYKVLGKLLWKRQEVDDWLETQRDSDDRASA